MGYANLAEKWAKDGKLNGDEEIVRLVLWVVARYTKE